MQKKRVVLVLIAIFLVLAGLGGTKKVVKMRQEAQKERQIAFLKTHEKEMTEYVKNKSRYVIIKDYDITDIKYDWESIRVVRSMAFSPKMLGIEVSIFNNSKELDGFEIYIIPDDINRPSKIKNIR
ncbi:MAG: hypothetical protein K2O72_08395 [Ligilactobacillus sp.]|nr:hypothetical protein [Ligilactobacillus sp.]